MDVLYLPWVLCKSCQPHFPAHVKSGTTQDRKRDIPAHTAGVLSWQQAEALVRSWVGVWVPVGRYMVLPGGTAAVTAYFHALDRAAVSPTIDGYG